MLRIRISNLVVRLSAFVLLFGFIPLTALADFDDFVDETKSAIEEKYCTEANARCGSCDEKAKKKEKYCKCEERLEKCLANMRYSNKDAIKADLLPQKAKDELAKIIANQDKAMKKCQDNFNKVFHSCEKKFAKQKDDAEDYGNKVRDCIAEKNATIEQDYCIETVMQKYSYKSKNMEKLLKGVTPPQQGADVGNAQNVVAVEHNVVANAKQCDPAQSPDLLSTNHDNRIKAMRSCLDVHKQLITEDDNLAKWVGPVTKLVTYGPKVKLDSMVSKTPQQSWDFQVALIQRREERSFIADFKGMSKEEYDSARKIAMDNSDLIDVYNAWQKAGSNNSDKKIYLLASISKLYPQFIDHAEYGFDVKGVEKNAEQIEGEKIGDQLDLGFDSTAGMGVYFALDGVDSAEHARGEVSALVCPVAGLYVVNTERPEVMADLMKARIINPQDVRTKEAQPFVSPTAKNLWSMPVDLEQAAQGLMVAYRPAKRASFSTAFPYIVDKKAMDYRTCTPLRLSDFQQCQRFERLLTTNFGGPSIFDMLKKDTKSFDKDIFSYWGSCNTEGKHATVKQIVESEGGKLMLASEPGQSFFKSNKKEFDKLLKSAGCSLDKKTTTVKCKD